MTSGAARTPPERGGQGGEAPVAGVVAAAGMSRRMGRNKLLLEVEGQPLVRRSAQVALRAGLDPVVVVTGHDAEPVSAAVADLPCRIAFNPEYEAGLHASLAVGADSVASDPVAAVVVMLADMPFVTASMLRKVVACHRATKAAVVVSRYGEGPSAPPVLFNRGLFGELAAMDSGGGRAIIEHHRADAEEVVWPPEAARDVDRPDDYHSVRAALAG